MSLLEKGLVLLRQVSAGHIETLRPEVGGQSTLAHRRVGPIELDEVNARLGKTRRSHQGLTANAGGLYPPQLSERRVRSVAPRDDLETEFVAPGRKRDLEILDAHGDMRNERPPRLGGGWPSSPFEKFESDSAGSDARHAEERRRAANLHRDEAEHLCREGGGSTDVPAPDHGFDDGAKRHDEGDLSDYTDADERCAALRSPEGTWIELIERA